MAIASGTPLHLDANDPWVLIGSGIALRRAGRLQEAADVFWQALAIVPLLLEARLHLGNTLAQIQRQLAATAQVLQADAGVQREVERLMQSAEASLGAGQSADALIAFARAGRLWPYSAELHSRMGAVLWELGALEEALVHYDLAARFRPDWPEAFDHAGTLAAALGLAERAKIYLGATQQMQPSDPLSLRLALVLPAIEDSSASVLQTRQRYEEAL